MYTTREEWLAAALQEQAPIIEALTGLTVPERVRISTGLPSTYRRSGAQGETWAPTASADDHWQVFISPTLADPRNVFEQVLHEVMHCATGSSAHLKTYENTAPLVGLQANGSTSDPWSRTNTGPAFDGIWSAILDGLGPYPHGALLAGVNQAKQSTRMMKCWCPSCGWTFRTTPKHIRAGMPTCVCGDTFATDYTETTTEE